MKKARDKDNNLFPTKIARKDSSALDLGTKEHFKEAAKGLGEILTSYSPLEKVDLFDAVKSNEKIVKVEVSPRGRA